MDNIKTEYIEETIHKIDQLEEIKHKISTVMKDKQVTRLNLYFQQPYKVIIDVADDEYMLKTILTIFNDDIKGKIYDVFGELENKYFNNN